MGCEFCWQFDLALYACAHDLPPLGCVAQDVFRGVTVVTVQNPQTSPARKSQTAPTVPASPT